MQSRAFSLVELSIVLVILGLLTGGILTGQSLIRAAELRSIATQFQSYQTASMTFRDKYFALPGDMKNATQFWGAADATADTCTTTVGTGTQTCNGDGNGRINTFSTDSSLATRSEPYRFWEHLVNAELLQGTYTGVRGTGSIPNENVPAAKADSAGWTIYDIGSGGDTSRYDLTYGDTLMYGTPTGSSITQGQSLTPEEAWGIDKKLDDELPASGKVIARFWNDACAAADDGSHANNDLVASYKLSESSKTCAIMFRQLF